MKKTTMIGRAMLTILFIGQFSLTLAQTKVKTTFVSGTESGGKESTELVADGYKWTKWCMSDEKKMPYFVILDVQQPTEISQYGLVTGDDTNSYPGRNPLAWNIYGSNDQKEWSVINRVKFDQRMSDENEQEYRYRIHQPQTFRYYKFEFTRMTSGTMIQLSEINLYSK